jgi:prephenate dehydrogenase
MSLDPAAAGRLGTVRVVGTGLLGTSVGLALRACGIRVLLADPSPTALALARDLGAGEPDPDDVQVDLVVVACPPDVTAAVVHDELTAHPTATITDVASVKHGPAETLAANHADLSRYVGGHPMAGRERSGPVAARSDLFLGRPWVVCPTPESEPERVEQIRGLATALGATAIVMPASEHDQAVALVSHLPQVASSLVAARMRQAADPLVALAGQGLRDLTRIAGSDPLMWAQILSANAGPVSSVLRDLQHDLDLLVESLEGLQSADGEPGALATIARLIADGNAGRDRIPGKHGAPPTAYAVVTALLPDRPGQLARLFQDIGDAGINVEEFSLEHAPGQMLGLAQVSVLPAAREALEAALTERGWHVVG